jgi:hypothetical protein
MVIAHYYLRASRAASSTPLESAVFDTPLVPHAYSVKVSHLPPVGTLFSAFLGYNPMQTTLRPEPEPALGPEEIEAEVAAVS